MTAGKPELQIRVALNALDRLGPGKIALLEAIDASGSLAAAGRSMDMSYRRARFLVDTLNDSFRKPAVMVAGRGGRTRLSPFGHELMVLYRGMEQAAEQAVAPHLRRLAALLAAKRRVPARQPRRKIKAKWG